MAISRLLIVELKYADLVAAMVPCVQLDDKTIVVPSDFKDELDNGGIPYKVRLLKL